MGGTAVSIVRLVIGIFLLPVLAGSLIILALVDLLISGIRRRPGLRVPPDGRDIDEK